MLHSLVQLLPVHPRIKLSIWPRFSKSWFEHCLLDALFWPNEPLQKILFPPAQLTFLSEYANNLLKGALAVVFLKKPSGSPCCLWMVITFLSPQLEDQWLFGAHYRNLAEHAVIWLNHTDCFSEFSNPLISWYKHFRIAKIK